MTDLDLLVRMEVEYARDQRMEVLRGNPQLRVYMQRRTGAVGTAAVRRETTKYFRLHIRSRNSVVSIAEAEGRPAGFSVISIFRPKPDIRQLNRLGRLDLFYVRRGYRRKGISSLMWAHAREWFAKRGIQHVGLEVASDNAPAVAIYHKWGFCDFFIEMRRQL